MRPFAPRQESRKSALVATRHDDIFSRRKSKATKPPVRLKAYGKDLALEEIAVVYRTVCENLEVESPF
jgi:hypothetical protein